MMVSDSGGKIWPSRRKYRHSPRTLTIAVVKMPNSDDRSQDSPFVKRHMEDHGVSRKRLDRGGGEDRRGRHPRACVRGPSRPPPVCPVLPGAWNPASSGRPAGRSLRHPHGGRAHGTKSTGASASGRFGAVGPLVGIARPREEVPVTARGFSTIHLCEAKLTAFPLRKNTSSQMTGVPKTHSLSGRMT